MPDDFVLEFNPVSADDGKKETVELRLSPEICYNKLPLGNCQDNVDENVFCPWMDDAQATG